MRSDCRGEGFGGAPVRVREVGALEFREQWMAGQFAVTRFERCAGPGDPLQPGDPVDVEVIGVPERREHSAGAQHPRDLRERALLIEPVQRLPDGDGVDRIVRQRNGFGDGTAGGDAGMSADQFGEHLRIRFDGDDRCARGEQTRRQLSGARAEIDDDGRVRRVERLQRPADTGQRVVGPVFVVGGGVWAEGLGASGT